MLNIDWKKHFVRYGEGYCCTTLIYIYGRLEIEIQYSTYNQTGWVYYRETLSEEKRALGITIENPSTFLFTIPTNKLGGAKKIFESGKRNADIERICASKHYQDLKEMIEEGEIIYEEKTN